MKITSPIALAAAACVALAACTGAPAAAPPTESVEPVLAMSGEVLSPEEAEVFREHATPIDPDEVAFESNIDLDKVEVSQRADAISETYEIGEPLSMEDLEFVRAYLTPAAESTYTEAPETVTALYSSSGEAFEVIPAGSVSWTCASSRRTAAGTTACTSGTSRFNLGAVNHTWSGGWTAQRTAGANLREMTSTLHVELYGAIAAWPYVGKVVDWKRSETKVGIQSTYFSRSGTAAAAVAYWRMNGRTLFKTASGSFDIGFGNF